MSFESSSERYRSSRSHRRKKFSLVQALCYLRLLLLITIPIVVSWDFGGVLPWTQWAMMIGCAILLVASLPRLLTNLRSMPLTSSLVILGLAICLFAFCQTMRLPNWLARIASPGSAHAYQEMIPDDIRQEGINSGDSDIVALAKTSHPVSVAVALTRNALTLPIAASTFVLVAALTISTPGRLTVAAVAVVIAGAVTSFMGIADRLGAESMSTVLFGGTSSTFATFVNRNNAAGFLNLTLAAVVGLIVWRYLWQREQRPWDDRFDVNQANWVELIFERFRRAVSYADAMIMFLLIAGVIIVSGVLICGSRGGFAGALVGAILVVWRGLSRNRSFAATATFFTGAVIVGMFLGFVGMLDRVRDRLSTLFGDAISSDGRWDHWRDGLWAAVHYFPSGSGLGTYRYAYLPYQEHSAGGWYFNADNLYLELLVEGGIWLPVILLLMLWILFTALHRLVERQHDPAMAGVTSGVWFALAAMGVSQAFDFGLLLPANYLLFSLIIGATVGMADRLGQQTTFRKRRSPGRESGVGGYYEKWNVRDEFDSDEEDSSDSELIENDSDVDIRLPVSVDAETGQVESAELDNGKVVNELSLSDSTDSAYIASPQSNTEIAKSKSKTRAFTQQVVSGYHHICVNPKLVIGLAFLLLILTLGRIAFLAQLANLDYWNRVLHFISMREVIELTTVERMEARIKSLVSNDPQNYSARNTLSETLLLVDRAAAVDVTLNDKSSERRDPLAMWQLANIDVRRAVYYSGSIPIESRPQDILLPGESLKRLQDARLQAIGALLVCPLDDLSRQVLLKLDFIAPGVKDVTSKTQSAIRVDQLGKLRKNWTTGLHRLAILALVRPGPETALGIWKRVLTLDPKLLNVVWKDASPLVSESAFVEALPDDIGLLLQFASMVKSEDASAAVLTRAEQLLDETSAAKLPAGQFDFWKAQLAQLEGQTGVAVWHYAIAVQNNPSKTEWRFLYASALQLEGKIDLATEQIRRCILQQPAEMKYQVLERELRRL